MAPKKNRPRRMKANVLVERQVRALLAASASYRQLPTQEQQNLARDMVQIGTYLVEPANIAANELPGAIAVVPSGEIARDFLDSVNFPNFVASLITGVFQAIVDVSIRQMEAFAELVSNVAKTAEEFAKDHIGEETARDWLATVYPDYLERDSESGTLRLLPGVNRAEALKRFRFLPLTCPIKKLGPAEIEKALVPAARRRIAAKRQQLLATMVLMGATR